MNAAQTVFNNTLIEIQGMKVDEQEKYLNSIPVMKAEIAKKFADAREQFIVDWRAAEAAKQKAHYELQANI